MSPSSLIRFALSCICMCAHSSKEAKRGDDEEEEARRELFISTIYPRRSVILHFNL